ncbi:unnamed protein product [Nippostrongylus brasiliensis]|uniref:Uncharacterized protein n=1 Tax=Nippostrongylus brasiliensis TaxID=27835 RepID=A0A0N4Y5C2_NIPBR|nr:unnamed protein product [Nippostrongylus brasiliensis]
MGSWNARKAVQGKKCNRLAAADDNDDDGDDDDGMTSLLHTRCSMLSPRRAAMLVWDGVTQTAAIVLLVCETGFT